MILVNTKSKPVANPLRFDPSRTTALRRAFGADMLRRMSALKSAIYQLIVVEDAFGHRQPKRFTINTRFKFLTDDEKLKAFNRWFENEVKRGVLQVDHQGKPWTAKYVDSAYRKGRINAYLQAHWEEYEKGTDWLLGGREQFLRSAFMQPETVQTLRLLGTRNFEQLKGITADMSSQLSRILASGIAAGRAPQVIAREINKSIDGINKRRARLLASTECLPANTLVSGAAVQRAFKRWYSGPMVEIKTANGRKFSCTPNHPMLTTDGWIAAGSLNQSHYLVSDKAGNSNIISGNPDIQRRPSTIGEIFNTLRTIGTCERKITSYPDFHGDGTDGEVDVSSPNGELLFGNYATVSKHLVESVFTDSGKSASCFCGFCSRLFGINQKSCFCGISQNSKFSKSSIYKGLINAITLSNLGAGFASFITPDDFLNISLEFLVDLISLTPLLPSQFLGFGSASCNTGGSQNFLHGRQISFDCFGDLAAGQSRKIQINNLLSFFISNWFGASSNLDSGIYKSFSDVVEVSPFLQADVANRHSTQVEFDRVVSVFISPFSGHVYNLQTPCGYFTIANGLYTGNTAYAQSEGQLDSFEDLGVKEVGIKAEWTTAGDNRVCERCNALSGMVFKIKQARGLIPLHPLCRCAWSPVYDVKASKLRRRQIKALGGPLPSPRLAAVQDADQKISRVEAQLDATYGVKAKLPRERPSKAIDYARLVEQEMAKIERHLPKVVQAKQPLELKLSLPPVHETPKETKELFRKEIAQQLWDYRLTETQKAEVRELLRTEKINKRVLGPARSPKGKWQALFAAYTAREALQKLLPEAFIELMQQWFE